MKTIQVDGAKVGFGGFLYRVIAFDTARHIVPCLSVWSVSNESTNSWAKVGLKMNQLYGAAINNSVYLASATEIKASSQDSLESFILFERSSVTHISKLTSEDIAVQRQLGPL